MGGLVNPSTSTGPEHRAMREKVLSERGSLRLIERGNHYHSDVQVFFII